MADDSDDEDNSGDDIDLDETGTEDDAALAQAFGDDTAAGDIDLSGDDVPEDDLNTGSQPKQADAAPDTEADLSDEGEPGDDDSRDDASKADDQASREGSQDAASETAEKDSASPLPSNSDGKWKDFFGDLEGLDLSGDRKDDASIEDAVKGPEGSDAKSEMAQGQGAERASKEAESGAKQQPDQGATNQGDAATQGKGKKASDATALPQDAAKPSGPQNPSTKTAGQPSTTKPAQQSTGAKPANAKQLAANAAQQAGILPIVKLAQAGTLSKIFGTDSALGGAQKASSSSGQQEATKPAPVNAAPNPQMGKQGGAAGPAQSTAHPGSSQTVSQQVISEHKARLDAAGWSSYGDAAIWFLGFYIGKQWHQVPALLSRSILRNDLFPLVAATGETPWVSRGGLSSWMPAIPGSY